MEVKATVLFDEAIQKLKEANDELCRPEEDVVTSLVCKIQALLKLAIRLPKAKF